MHVGREAPCLSDNCVTNYAAPINSNSNSILADNINWIHSQLNGAPQSAVNSVLRDNNGYMYTHTTQGNTFNSIDFQKQMQQQQQQQLQTQMASMISNNTNAYNILTTQGDFGSMPTENVAYVISSLNNTTTSNGAPLINFNNPHYPPSNTPNIQLKEALLPSHQMQLPQQPFQTDKCLFPKIMSKEKSMRKVNQ